MNEIKEILYFILGILIIQGMLAIPVFTVILVVSVLAIIWVISKIVNGIKKIFAD